MTWPGRSQGTVHLDLFLLHPHLLQAPPISEVQTAAKLQGSPADAVPRYQPPRAEDSVKRGRECYAEGWDEDDPTTLQRAIVKDFTLNIWSWLAGFALWLMLFFCSGCLVVKLCEHLASVESPEAGRHHSVKVLELLTQNCMPHFSQSPAGDLVQAKGPLWTMLSSPYHGRKSSLSRWLVRNIRWNDMSLLCLYYHVKPKGTVAESAGSGNGMTGFKSQLCHLKLCLWTSYLTF